MPPELIADRFMLLGEKPRASALSQVWKAADSRTGAIVALKLALPLEWKPEDGHQQTAPNDPAEVARRNAPAASARPTQAQLEKRVADLEAEVSRLKDGERTRPRARHLGCHTARHTSHAVGRRCAPVNRLRETPHDRSDAVYHVLYLRKRRIFSP